MEKKTKILIVVGLVALIGFVIYFIWPVKPVPYYPIELTENKLVTNQTLIDLIVINKTSPGGNNLTEMILDEDNLGENDSWQIAYYVCDDNEHVGWVYNHEKNSKSKPELYGPYGWCYI